MASNRPGSARTHGDAAARAANPVGSAALTTAPPRAGARRCRPLGFGPAQAASTWWASLERLRTPAGRRRPAWAWSPPGDAARRLVNGDGTAGIASRFARHGE